MIKARVIVFKHRANALHLSPLSRFLATTTSAITLTLALQAAPALADGQNTAPHGLGYEQYVPVPMSADPLPVVNTLPRNEGNGRFFLQSNPINYALRGINDIWKGTTDNWQATAGTYKRDVNGYKAGDGPNPVDAVNGKPADYVKPGTEIRDAATWEANIRYVEKVTNNRSDEDSLRAFLDDIRSKNYSVIDGLGPLTEDYAENAGAYTEFEPILLSDVLENKGYKPSNNDSTKYGGDIENSPLAAMVKLPWRMRAAHASTSGPKYLFGTPRPWRMTSTGEVKFQSVESLECVDGSSPERAVKTYRIDSYDSKVKLVPGLFCGRRGHSSKKEKTGLYSASTENRRKDNGYPSGHTNAGVLASYGMAYAMPERFEQLLARGADLGENRILAGMHSPVDVIGGRIQATMVAAWVLNHYQDEAQAAYEAARAHFGAEAADAGMSLYDFANRTVEEEGSRRVEVDGKELLNTKVFNNNFYADGKKLRETYTFQMTYGLPQTGEKGLAPIVPEGAEALLRTRQPYLSAAQRRAVLATTEIDSGYPLLDKTNGWGRLNLVAAGDGYGAFQGDVTVTMDADQGGFSAKDIWRNDISGEGLLTKRGSGELILTGANSYTGGTVVEGGVLEAQSATAFGKGAVYIDGGAVALNANAPVQAGGDFTLVNGALTVAPGSYLEVSGKAQLGGVLRINLAGSDVKADDILTVMTAKGGVSGAFASVDVSGELTGKVIVNGNAVQVQILN